MSAAILVAYFMLLGVLSLLGLHRLLLVFRRPRPPGTARGRAPAPARPERVLVQLPLYNEALVAGRLLRAVARLRHPTSHLHLQILDDSDDGTRAMVDGTAAELRRQGLRVDVVRRPTRDGFKAGALAEGLRRAPQAEVVAIFDADFVPPADFLERTLPVLASASDVGMVQARWTHLNREASWLTRAQAVFLDGHFAVEHAARDAAGAPFNFNGTAGVWRRAAIEDAGGWHGDTITEDLDLSYRAQLAGWRFRYLDDATAPAELPESWSAFRSQQARWVRGSIQTARKLSRRVARSERFGWRARGGALLHLWNNLAYGLMAGLALLLPLALVLREELGWRVPGGRPLLGALDLGMLGAGTLAVATFYLAAVRRVGEPLLGRLPDVLVALCVGAGMSLSNAREALRGFGTGPAEFVRTPKAGDARSGRPRYRARTRWAVATVELVAALAYAGVAAYAVWWQVWGALPFLALYGVGFGAVGGGTLLESWRRGASERSALPKLVEADDLGASRRR